MFLFYSGLSQATGLGEVPCVPLVSRLPLKKQCPLRSGPTHHQKSPKGGALQSPTPPAPLISSPGEAGCGHGLSRGSHLVLQLQKTAVF